MSDWTDDRVERLKAYWVEGLSCSQCARKLGGVTRNAVIGKVSRLGLNARGTTVRKTRPVNPARPLLPKLVIVKPETPPPPPLCAPESFPDGAGCRFTHDDVSQPNWVMCGNPVYAPGTNWCIHHAGIVFQPQQTAASRKKAESVDARVQDRQMRRMGL